MEISKQYTDLAILSEIGERISRRRLSFNLTQARLAESAGVSKRTIERMEKGESVQLTSFVRILRALELVDHLDGVVPGPGPSGVEPAEPGEKRRKRASNVRRRRPGDEARH